MVPVLTTLLISSRIGEQHSGWIPQTGKKGCSDCGSLRCIPLCASQAPDPRFSASVQPAHVACAFPCWTPRLQQGVWANPQFLLHPNVVQKQRGRRLGRGAPIGRYLEEPQLWHKASNPLSSVPVGAPLQLPPEQYPRWRRVLWNRVQN